MNKYNSETEQWIAVEFNNRYEVSNKGRVRRIVAGKSTKINRVLKPRKNDKGYVSVMLYFGTKDNKRSFSIHKLVAHAFLGKKPEGYEINHKNGVKHDNLLENLEYVTPSQNVQHAFDYLNHFRARGDTNGNAVLSEDQAIEIKTLLRSGAKGRDIAKQFGVSVSTVSAIKHRRIWQHLEDISDEQA